MMLRECQARPGRHSGMPKIHPVISLIIALPAWPLQAWALHLAWGWFVVPMGAPEVGFVYLLGAVVSTRLALHVPSIDLYVDNHERWASEGHMRKRALAGAVSAYVAPLMIILLGYAIHLFA